LWRVLMFQAWLATQERREPATAPCEVAAR
jgi:hypothetical protein